MISPLFTGLLVLIFGSDCPDGFYIVGALGNGHQISAYERKSDRIELIKSAKLPTFPREHFTDSAISPSGSRLLLISHVDDDPPDPPVPETDVSSKHPMVRSSERALILDGSSLAQVASIPFKRGTGWFRWIDDRTFEHYSFRLAPFDRPAFVTRYSEPEWEPRPAPKRAIPFHAVSDRVLRKAVRRLAQYKITKPVFLPLDSEFSENNFAGGYATSDSISSIVVVFGHIGQPKPLSLKSAHVILLQASDGWKPRIVGGSYSSCSFLNMFDNLIVFGTRETGKSDIVHGFDRVSLRQVFKVPGSLFIANNAFPPILRPAATNSLKRSARPMDVRALSSSSSR